MWLTVDKPLEKCAEVDRTGNQCMLFAWHSGHHSNWTDHSGSFWLSRKPSPWAITLRSSCEINQGELNVIPR